MEQLSLLDWLDKKLVIVESLPTQHIQHHAFIIEQLKPILSEFEALNLSNQAISQAMAYYQNIYQIKAQKSILKPST